jgi:hypothetical protein
MQDQERIRQRAQEIWEREGRPDGCHNEHWAQARREIEAESVGSTVMPPDDRIGAGGTEQRLHFIVANSARQFIEAASRLLQRLLHAR